MAEIVHDCPRCGASKITFTVTQDNRVNAQTQRFELFCICRRCGNGTIFYGLPREITSRQLLAQGSVRPTSITHTSLDNFMRVDGYVNSAEMAAIASPEHLPSAIESVFNEGARCQAVGCFNAAGTMYRLCVDLATRDLLPAAEEPNGPNAKQRRDLGLRLPWLFSSGKLPLDLHDLASCVKEDGNDGAHTGTLGLADAEDLLDFTVALLERLYTEPARIRLAATRRAERRSQSI